MIELSGQSNAVKPGGSVHSASIALGTNLGDRLANLAQALTLLTAFSSLRRWSGVFETPPWGYLDQPAFLNMVIEVETSEQPLDLLDHLKFLEEKIGRKKSVRYGPRLIDLDILFYDEIEWRSERLEIPHPRIAERAFVLVPLAELAPDRVLQPHGASIKDLLLTIDRSGIEQVMEGNEGSPAEFAAALQNRPEVREVFLSLPSSRQQEYLKHIFRAKRPATRLRRISRTIQQLGTKRD